MANARGVIAVDKMGGKVLFLDPATYQTQIVLEGFPRTVHELLVVPETGLAYVPIFGDGIHGRNPNPQHIVLIFDLEKRAHVGTIDLHPYIAPHTLKLGPDGMIYITCESSAVVAVIDRKTHKMVEAIDSGSTNGHRLIIAPDGQRLYTENEEDAEVSVIDLPRRKLIGKIKTPRPLAGIAISADGRTIVAVDDAEPALFLIDAETGRVRDEVRLEGVRQSRADRPLCARQQPYRRHQPQCRHREPDRPVVPAADRDRRRQPADGHGLPWRRIVRCLSGRRLGARDRHSEPAAQVELQSRGGLRVAGILLAPAPRYFVNSPPSSNTISASLTPAARRFAAAAT